MRSLKKTIVLTVDPDDPSMAAISKAAEVIRRGGLVAFPTETVYGLAANLLKKSAIDRLYKVKSRPRGKPFTVHIAHPKMIKDMGCTVTDKAEALIKRFWPGPLTIVLKAKKQKSIGFRMPKNRVARELIKASGVPIVAPSANISGRNGPATARDVLKQLNGKIEMLLDSGPASIGIESTVVDMTVTPPKILREGAIPKEEISKVLGHSS